MNGADIIGQGWRFPIKVNAKGGLDWSSGPDRIRDAIWIILSTSLGERLMRPTFGAGIKDYVFEPNSEMVRAQLETAIQHALTTWEPRIDVVSVQASASPDQDSLVLVSIDYQIRDTNELFNMVYPLFLQEGTV
ncbi:MAG TPA: GPW/gp25 family protein [Bryobacteraceae bacterium]|nr:GPW/gp25 family protein [Bryobacteraceae bacterium]